VSFFRPAGCLPGFARPQQNKPTLPCLPAKPGRETKQQTSKHITAPGTKHKNLTANGLRRPSPGASPGPPAAVACLFLVWSLAKPVRKHGKTSSNRSHLAFSVVNVATVD